MHRNLPECLFPWVFADSGISEVVQLRLVNGSSRCAGRVEVLHNQQWGTVCDDSWDLQDAGVVCRQLSCGMALSAPGGARFGGGSDRIWLDDVHCTGTEATLSHCRARPWGDNNCNHGEDAGVVCSGISEVTLLRLVNGPSRCAGRVEVLHNQLWGTVCDDSWDITDAGVVCRQLGCGTALSAPGGARFGRGSDRIWLDDVHCTGTEAALTECRARPWGDNNCHHGEDAGVVCSDSGISEVSQLRLVNGSSRCTGRVEVLHNQQWGTVCEDNWDITDAGVVCRQLGCGTALSAPGGARFGEGSDRIWLDDVHCMGTEAALTECRARPWGDNNCHHGEDAGVSSVVLRACAAGNSSGTTMRAGCQWWRFSPGQAVAVYGADLDPKVEGATFPSISNNQRHRNLPECLFPWVFEGSGISEVSLLQQVHGHNRWTGRVEVFHNQQWGTGCDGSLT
uniref:Soluble scavenger receptor cysteine-rich domain-containing protein SSC5D n=1 Tax=Terrapene triunguis TaxID=2587831 RepID=A0A674JTI0_9SAUR